MTTFKRQARLHQAKWRVQHDLALGSHRSGRPRQERPNGSRIDLEEARTSGANFLSDHIRAAVSARLGTPEAHQTLDENRLWTDLLSSMPMCFNLFGELHDNPDRLTTATAAIWPDAIGVPENMRFEWSPGRRDPAYLADRTAFDAAIVLRQPNGTRGVIGIETKYHEHITRERAPDPTTRLPRYREVTERSGIFKAGWEDAVLGTDLQQIWRDHLLVLAMLQHPDDAWTYGRYVLVHPGQNPSFAEASERYRTLLVEDSTFQVRTIEVLLEARVLHPPTIEEAFRERYLLL